LKSAQKERDAKKLLENRKIEVDIRDIFASKIEKLKP
jgi:arsenate reductase-like glutaredoxin family protein